MLKMNPEERLSITELVNQLQEIAAARNVNPKSPITEVGVCPIVFSTVVKKNTMALDLRRFCWYFPSPYLEEKVPGFLIEVNQT